MAGKDSFEVVFDGATVTATTSDTSATITVAGYLVSVTDAGALLAIRGGANFTIGVYFVKSADSNLNTWTLDRPCTTGPGSGMIGKIVTQEGRWHEQVPEYYDQNLPNNPGQREARQQVLKMLSVLEPEVLKSLAETCLKREC